MRRLDIPLGSVNFHASKDDGFQPPRNGLVDIARRLGCMIEPAFHSRERGRTSEWLLACDELIEDAAQRKQVACGIGPFAQHLFRRNIGCSTHRHGTLLAEEVRKLGVAGEAEVQKHGAAFGKDYVLGFEIEMDDLLAM